MRNAFLVILLGFLCNPNGYTQTTVAPQLPDSTEFPAHLQRAESWCAKNGFDSALVEIKRAETLLQTMCPDTCRQTAGLFYVYGYFYFRQRNVKNTISYLESAFQIRSRFESPGQEVDFKIQYLLGSTYVNIGLGEAGVQYLTGAAQLADHLYGADSPESGKSNIALARAYASLENFESARAILSKTQKIYDKKYGRLELERERLTTAFGVVLDEQGEYREALPYFQESADIMRANFGERSPLTAGAYNDLGVCLMFMGDVLSAKKYFEKSLVIHLDPANQASGRYAEAYNNMAACWMELGVYENALNCLYKVLEWRQKNLPAIHPKTARTALDIARCYTGLGDPNKALEFGKMAVQLAGEKPGTTDETVFVAHSTIGDAYFKMGELDLALEYYTKAYQPEKLSGSLALINALNYFTAVARLSAQTGDDRKAIQYRRAAIAENCNLYGIPNAGAAVNALNLACLYYSRQQTDSCAAGLDTALFYLGFDRSTGRCRQGNPSEIIDVFSTKATFEVGRYVHTRNLHHLHEAAFFNELINRTIRDYRDEVFANQKISIHEPTFNYRESAVATFFLLHRGTDSLSYLHQAFIAAERARSLALYENTVEKSALHFSAIPDSLLDLEHAFRRDVAYYEKKYFERANLAVSTADSTLLSLNSRLLDLRQQYESLKKILETDYPDYYRLKYDLRVEDVAAVQRDLLYPDMAMVEYFVGDSAVYIFTIRKQDYSVIEVKKDFPLEQWVAQLRRGMTAFHTDPGMTTQYDTLSALYTDAAYQLYQKLVAPIAAKLPGKVVVIPDGVLGYVPFEALLVEKPENPTRWSQHHYWLNDHAVSYSYSATMLREMLYRRHKQAPALNFLGFAPQYDGDTTLLAALYPYADDMRKDLKPLPHSGEEVFRGARMMNGEALLGPSATKVAFEENAPRARILHLAAHGQANDRAGDYCFLVFAGHNDSAKNEILYARDIYNLQLNADLVTLSACETGIGELQRGEGIISLARAFAYAGAKSIVTSLWSVSDGKTKDLMIDFYKNLRKGMLKDDALRQAKLDFLKRNRGQAAHPFYWAGFVGIGNMGGMK